MPFYLVSFFKSLRNHTSHQVGGLFGGTLVIGLITEPLGFVQDAWDVMVLFGVVVVVVCWTSLLQDETPVCHACLVVNGTSNFIINIPSRHGCWGVNVWSPAGNYNKSVNVWSLARVPEQQLQLLLLLQTAMPERNTNVLILRSL